MQGANEILDFVVYFGLIRHGVGNLLTQATLVAAAFITIYTMEGEVVHTFSNMFISDLMGDFLKLMIYFSTAIA